MPEMNAMRASDYSLATTFAMILDVSSATLTLRLLQSCPLCVLLAICGVFTPVLAKHSKSFSLIDCIAVVCALFVIAATNDVPKLVFQDQPGCAMIGPAQRQHLPINFCIQHSDVALQIKGRQAALAFLQVAKPPRLRAEPSWDQLRRRDALGDSWPNDSDCFEHRRVLAAATLV